VRVVTQRVEARIFGEINFTYARADFGNDAAMTNQSFSLLIIHLFRCHSFASINLSADTNLQ
jgi:hypothetical protein